MDVTADIANARKICRKPNFLSPPLELVYRDGDEKSSFSPGGLLFIVLLPKLIPLMIPPLEEELAEY